MKLSLIVSLIYFNCLAINASDFWLSHHVDPLSPQEQELLLCTLEIAIKRCQATLNTQKAAEQLIEYIHQETDFIASTRLQPANCRELDAHVDEPLQNWCVQKKRYIDACLHYDTYVSLVDAQPNLLEAFNYVRQEARSAVLKATAYESYRLKDCAITLTEYGQKAFTSVQLLQSLMGKRSMLDDITQWFASLLVMPFKECNDQITLINDQSWQLVEKQHAFGNYVWTIIEEARLKIYKQYYYALAVKLKKDVKELLHEN